MCLRACVCVDRIYFLQQEISLTDFAAEDLAARVKFFGSSLYKDFAQKRSKALLWQAKTQTDATVRAEWLQVVSSSVTNLEGGECDALKQTATWGMALFGDGVPAEVSISFAFCGSSAAGAPDPATQATALERLRFAASFAKAPGDVAWECLLCFAEPVEIPSRLSCEIFMKLAPLVPRNAVMNPVVAACIDFLKDAS